MTDFFQALLDRAEGTASGLEPRKASRFENDPGVSQDVSDFPLPSAELPLPAPATYRAPSELPLARNALPPPPPTTTRERETIVSSPMTAVENAVPTKRNNSSANEPADFEPAPVPPRLPLPDSAAPSVPAPQATSPSGEHTPPSPVTEVHVFEPRELPGAPSAPSPAPSPLAAPPVTPLSPSLVNLFQPTLVLAETAAAAAPTPPPVIEISIGTIEFRAAPPPPTSPTAAPRLVTRDARGLPSLEDYLKSRRSVRS